MTTIEEQLILHEGLRLKPYKCTADKTTIGVGRNLEGKGITAEEAMYLLRNDIDECVKDLYTIFHSFDMLVIVRKNALIDLRFNIGPSRFRKFKKMIQAVNEGDFVKAATEMEHSHWYHQVGQRAVTLCNMMREGM